MGRHLSLTEEKNRREVWNTTVLLGNSQLEEKVWNRELWENRNVLVSCCCEQWLYNLLTWNKHYVLSQSICSSGIWEQFTWEVLRQGSLRGCRQGVGQGWSHLKPWMGLEDLTLSSIGVWPETWLVCLLHGLLGRVAHDMTTRFPWNKK